MLRSSDGAEDAAQDALVAALSNLDRFRGDAQLGTWLYRVGANAVLMTMRRDRRTADRTVRATAQLPQESCWLHGSSGSPQPQFQLEAAQRAQLLRWAVEQLPERYRSVVMQCDLDERPIEEVATALGISIGGVRTRRLRAHRMIKDALQRSTAASVEP
jgi:RNA polymerase sigma-70 factor (ECF subfamily)